MKAPQLSAALLLVAVAYVVDCDLCRGNTYQFAQAMVVRLEAEGAVPQDSNLPTGTYVVIADDKQNKNLTQKTMWTLENELEGFETLGRISHSVVVGHFRSSQVSRFETIC